MQRQRLIPLGIALVPYSLLVWKFNFLADDAFISFRYARNFAKGLGLRYNIGVEPPVEGYSNFLWTLWMALFEWLGADVTLWSRVSSVACGVGLIAYLVHFLQRRMSLERPLVVAAAIFFSTLPPVAVWSTGGLETMAFALAVFAVYERLLGAPDRPHGIQAGLLAVTAILLRTDGIVWVGLVLAAAGVTWLFRRRVELTRAALSTLAVLVVGLVLYLSWRFSYYGDFVSNTAHVKVTFSTLSIERGWKYVASLLLTFPALAIAALLPVFFRMERYRLLVLQSMVFVLGGSAYVIAAGGDFMCMGRLLVPVMPFVALLLSCSLQAIATGSARRRSIALATAGVLTLIFSLPAAFDRHVVPKSVREKLHFRWNMDPFLSEHRSWEIVRRNTRNWTLIGKSLPSRTEPGESLVRGPIGAVGYYSNLFIYDLAGLVTREVSSRDVPERRRSAGHSKSVRRIFFRKYKPTYFFVKLKIKWEKPLGMDVPREGVVMSLLEAEKIEIIKRRHCEFPRDGSYQLELIPLESEEGTEGGERFLVLVSRTPSAQESALPNAKRSKSAELANWQRFLPRSVASEILYVEREYFSLTLGVGLFVSAPVWHSRPGKGREGV